MTAQRAGALEEFATLSDETGFTEIDWNQITLETNIAQVGSGTVTNILGWRGVRADSAADIDGTDVVYKNFVHMGIAVGTPNGLVVPVVRNADQMSFAEVESTKSVNDVYAPVSGVVSAVNDPLLDTPELVNSDPFGEGWFIKIRPLGGSNIDHLMDAAAYRVFTED